MWHWPKNIDKPSQNAQMWSPHKIHLDPIKEVHVIPVSKNRAISHNFGQNVTDNKTC